MGAFFKYDSEPVKVLGILIGFEAILETNIRLFKTSIHNMSVRDN